MPIHVQSVDATCARALAALRVHAHQRAFVGSMRNLLADVAVAPHSEALAILLDDQAIGYYRLHFNTRAVVDEVFDEPAVALRAWFIDARFQGRGLGRRALDAVCADLRSRHPDRRLLVLTVDCGNAVAIRTYADAGFIDSGQRYPGGHAGPQQLMTLRL